jgi:hypothetical protein
VARRPQDIKVNPTPPPAKDLKRPIGLSPTQNARLQADIKRLEAQGATNIRVNQQQVNVEGVRVGVNRPDLQYTLDGRRYYVEYGFASGVAGLLVAGWRAMRGPSRTRRSPKPLALASFGSLVLGGAAWWSTKSVREPRQSFVSDPRHFSSDALGVTLDAPSGWRLERDGATLTAIQGNQPADQAPANLTLISLAEKEPALAGRQLETLRQGLKQHGFAVGETFDDSIGGQPVHGFVAEGDRAKISNWMVERGPRWGLLVQCFTRDGSDPRAACGAALQRLILREPTDPNPVQ